jgi:RNA polymerase sigma factor (sigma-70 family)
MANRTAEHDLLSQLNILSRVGVVGGLSDGQLLRRFLSDRDRASQAAFTALVERHGPMVLRVCRQVLGNAGDAEDAFQATFLLLARKAASVHRADSVASWLHGVARRVAVRARENDSRRRVYERRSAAMKPARLDGPEPRPEEWADLHEEIARLPGRYREPVVLCYFEGLTSEAAADRLGCPQGTILSRLSRARQRLRRRLTERGYVVAALLHAQTLSAGPEVAVLPTGLLEIAVRASLAFEGMRAADAAIVSTKVVALARGGLCAMMISKSKLLAGLALVCAGALGWMQTFARSSDSRNSTEPPSSALSAAARAPETPAESRLAIARQEPKAPSPKPDKSQTSEFPYTVDFQQGATRFLAGDKITILEVRGTADGMAPGNLYWIRGTYTLASQDRAMVAAFTTATSAEEGKSATLKVQTAIVNRGNGTFTLFFPMWCKGWPHVSFYPADGGGDFGGSYFGTGDSVLKKWWGSK